MTIASKTPGTISVDVVDALRAYAAKDDVPRVSRAVTTIAEKINMICA